MSWNPFAVPDDPADPIRRAYNHFKKRIRNALLILLAVGVGIVAFGVPSVQWTYRHHPYQRNPTSGDKIDADYWNPIGGWRVVKAGELTVGCPMVILMPLRMCMDVTPYKNPFTLFVLGEEFFNET